MTMSFQLFEMASSEKASTGTGGNHTPHLSSNASNPVCSNGATGAVGAVGRQAEGLHRTNVAKINGLGETKSSAAQALALKNNGVTAPLNSRQEQHDSSFSMPQAPACAQHLPAPLDNPTTSSATLMNPSSAPAPLPPAFSGAVNPAPPNAGPYTAAVQPTSILPKPCGLTGQPLAATAYNCNPHFGNQPTTGYKAPANPTRPNIQGRVRPGVKKTAGLTIKSHPTRPLAAAAMQYPLAPDTPDTPGPDSLNESRSAQPLQPTQQTEREGATENPPSESEKHSHEPIRADAQTADTEIVSVAKNPLSESENHKQGQIGADVQSAGPMSSSVTEKPPSQSEKHNDQPSRADVQTAEPKSIVASEPSRPPEKKIPLVQEVTEVVFPPDFFETKKQAHEGDKVHPDPVDYLAKLGQMFVKGGGDEKSGIYETDRKCPFWEAVKPVRSSGPMPGAKARQPLTPGRRRGRRHRGTKKSNAKSIATEIYGDTRYIGVLQGTGKLTLQSVTTRERYGRLDTASIRDYWILPADYYVAEMEGLETAKKQGDEDGSTDDDGPPSSRSRRRRRQRGQEPERVAKKVKPPQITGSSVRVGVNYQVEIEPRLGDYRTAGDVSDIPRCDQIWDPALAEAAVQRGEDVEEFLDRGVDHNTKMLLMEALHRSGYSVSRAHDEFVSLFRASKEPTSQLQLDEIFQASTLFENSRKNFSAISKAMGRSVATVMVQYYQWKTNNRAGTYARLKKELRAEADSDYCSVCDDGGELIVCDNCHKAYHLKCHTPPLTQIPDSDSWFCCSCMKSPAKLRRIPNGMVETARDEVARATSRVLEFGRSGDKPGADRTVLSISSGESVNESAPEACTMAT